MGISDGNGIGAYMPVQPAMGNYGGMNGGLGCFGGDGFAWIIILLLALGNNWGNNRSGNSADSLVPYMMMNNSSSTNTDNDVQRGFDHQSIMSGLTNISGAITSGFSDMSLAICGVNQGVSNGFAQAEIAANSRQMANMNQQYANTTAMLTGFNNMQSQFANSCCENKLATADLKSTVLAENCEDRNALSNALRDILVANNNGVQRILDQMCNDKIDAKNEEISSLRTQLLVANSNNTVNNQTATIEQYLRQLLGCGCGCQNSCGCN